MADIMSLYRMTMGTPRILIPENSLPELCAVLDAHLGDIAAGVNFDRAFMGGDGSNDGCSDKYVAILGYYKLKDTTSFQIRRFYQDLTVSPPKWRATKEGVILDPRHDLLNFVKLLEPIAKDLCCWGSEELPGLAVMICDQVQSEGDLRDAKSVGKAVQALVDGNESDAIQALGSKAQREQIYRNHHTTLRLMLLSRMLALKHASLDWSKCPF